MTNHGRGEQKSFKRIAVAMGFLHTTFIPRAWPILLSIFVPLHSPIQYYQVLLTYSYSLQLDDLIIRRLELTTRSATSAYHTLQDEDLCYCFSTHCFGYCPIHIVQSSMYEKIMTDTSRNPDGTITCPPSASSQAFCEGDSLQTNIIIRCVGSVGQPGDCNDNRAGVPPIGVKTFAPCERFPLLPAGLPLTR